MPDQPFQFPGGSSPHERFGELLRESGDPMWREHAELRVKRDRALEDYLANLTFTAARSATVVIAASNSSPAGKAGADYVCDGTADETTIQEAIDFIAALGLSSWIESGSIVLLEGKYNLTGTVNITIPLLIQGSGAGNTTSGTVISCGSTVTAFTATNAFDIRDLTILNPAVAISADTVGEWVVQGCYFFNCDQALIATETGVSTFIWYGCKILNNNFVSCGVAAKYIIDLNLSASEQQLEGFRVSGNSFSLDSIFSDLRYLGSTSQGGGPMVISDNVFNGAVLLEDLGQVVIAGNPCNDSVTCNRVDYLTIDGNIIGGSLTVTSSSNVVLADNNIGNDLTVTSNDYMAVSGNVLADVYTQTTCTNVRRSGNVGITDA